MATKTTTERETTENETLRAASALPGGFEYVGTISADLVTMKDDDSTPEPSGPLHVWFALGDRIAVYASEDYADDGYPFAVAKFVKTVSGDYYWRHTGIAQDEDAALRMAERVADHVTFIRESEPGETGAEWRERTGGTEYEPGPFPWEDSE